MGSYSQPPLGVRPPQDHAGPSEHAEEEYTTMGSFVRVTVQVPFLPLVLTVSSNNRTKGTGGCYLPVIFQAAPGPPLYVQPQGGGFVALVLNAPQPHPAVGKPESRSSREMLQ